MNLSLQKLFGSVKSLAAAHRSTSRLSPRKNNRRLSLSVEALEDRMVPTVPPTWPGGHQPIHHPGETYLSITGVPTQITAGTTFSVSVTDYDA
jgi:hypothetical protein